jgi:hypothetical protein
VVTRYNHGMMETTLPLALEPWATLRAPDPAPLLEQLATLRRENAALANKAIDAACRLAPGGYRCR